MAGRPKGSTKSDSKKLQTYRLSKIEKCEVDKLLNEMRNKPRVSLPDVKLFEFKTGELCIKYNCLGPGPEQIEHLYVIIDYDFEKFIIVKCPVVAMTSKSYTMKIKSREFLYGDTDFRQRGFNTEFKINKTNLLQNGLQDFDLIHYHAQTFKTIDEALGYMYSNCLKSAIVHKLLQSNDIALIKRYLEIIEVSYHNEAMALEYVYNVLGLELFRIEEDGLA